MWHRAGALVALPRGLVALNVREVPGWSYLTALLSLETHFPSVTW